MCVCVCVCVYVCVCVGGGVLCLVPEEFLIVGRWIQREIFIHYVILNIQPHGSFHL